MSIECPYEYIWESGKYTYSLFHNKGRAIGTPFVVKNIEHCGECLGTRAPRPRFVNNDVRRRRGSRRYDDNVNNEKQGCQLYLLDSFSKLTILIISTLTSIRWPPLPYPPKEKLAHICLSTKFVVYLQRNTQDSVLARSRLCSPFAPDYKEVR